MKDSVIEELKRIPIGSYKCTEYSSIQSMLNKTFDKVLTFNNDTIIFINDKEAYVFYHLQNCCELVEIDDVCGNLSDLEGTPLLKAEEVTNALNTPRDEWDDSFTWTFYKFATIKGYVDIRWYGTSNGYYSESVDLVYFPIKDGKLIPII